MTDWISSRHTMSRAAFCCLCLDTEISKRKRFTQEYIFFLCQTVQEITIINHFLSTSLTMRKCMKKCIQAFSRSISVRPKIIVKLFAISILLTFMLPNTYTSSLSCADSTDFPFTLPICSYLLLPAGPLLGIQCPHRANVSTSLLVSQHWHVHM